MCKFHPSCLLRWIRVTIPTLETKWHHYRHSFQPDFQEFPELNSESDCAAVELCAFPSRVRTGETQHRPKQYSKVQRKVRVLEYFRDISSLMGKILLMYCSSIEPL